MNKEQELKEVKITGNSYRGDCKNCGRILRGSKEIEYCKDCQRAKKQGKKEGLTQEEINEIYDTCYNLDILNFKFRLDKKLQEKK